MTSTQRPALALKRLVLLGAPGSGKGTMAEMLATRGGLVHISTGDMLREAVKHGTSLGTQAKAYMERGELVPDDLIVAMVGERLAADDVKSSGYVLVGFPCNLNQGVKLESALQDTGLGLDRVLVFEAPDEVILERLTGRRVCRSCGRIYHVRFIPPRTEGRCDGCGGELYQRADDREETIRNRLVVYERETADLVRHFEGRHLVTRFDAALPRDQAFERLWDLVAEG